VKPPPEELWERRRRTFGAVAEQYDRARPGFPAAVFDEIRRHARLRSPGRLLEIGCGTGKATAPFAKAGHAITALEPSRNMATVAKKKLTRFPSVRFITAKFEQWDPPAAGFDVLFAAQSWHWLDQKKAFSKAARVLKPGGTLALFWNFAWEFERPLRKRLDAVYARFHRAGRKAAVYPTKKAMNDRFRRDREGITASGRFDGVRMRRFFWQAEYDSRSYLDLIDTYSDHRVLPAEKRRPLYSGIEKAIRETGGTVRIRRLCVLYLARPKKKAEFSIKNPPRTT